MTERPLPSPQPAFAEPPGRVQLPPEPPTPADLVVASVMLVPGVVDMHSGMYGEVATYLPGRRVNGVQIHADATQVHVVLRYGVDIARVAEEIKLVVQPLVGTPVDVTVQELADDFERP